MAGGKETPRQKMIGMMYLVLTALLALNVSKSILDAFITQDEQGLEQNKRIVESINGMATKLSLLKNDPQSKKSAEEIEPIYNDVRVISDKADDFLLSELNALFEATEQEKNWFTKDAKTQITSWKNFDEMKKKDDYDTPSNFFGGEKGTKSYKRGEALREELMKFRDELILTVAGKLKDKNVEYIITKDNLKSFEGFQKYLDEQKHPKRDNLLDIYQILTKPEEVEQHHEKRPWHIARFYHQPMVGVVGTFTSLRNDIRLAQQKASSLLMERVDVPMMNINKVEAQVLATTQYLNIGDTLGVKVGIVAYDSSKQYKIQYRPDSSGDYKEEPNGKFTIKADSPGPKYVEGKLFVEIAGQLQSRDWSFNYTVGKPSASVALPEMNVLYRGYPNKVRAVASGFPPDQVKVSCSGCSSFSKSGEDYIAKVGNGSSAKVTVTAGGKSVGYQEFRVLPLPKAQPFFVGKSYESTVVSGGSLRQGSKLTASLPNSPLNVKYSVTSFSMTAVQKGKVLDGGRSSGGSLSGKMQSIMKGLKGGDKVYFENVKIAGPDGKSYPVGGLAFKVK